MTDKTNTSPLIIHGHSHRLPSDFAWDSKFPPLNWTGWVIQFLAAGEWQVQINECDPITAKAGSVICSDIVNHHTRVNALGQRPIELLWVHLPHLPILNITSSSFLALSNAELGIQLFYRAIERLNPPNQDREGADNWIRAFLHELRDGTTLLGDATGSMQDEQTSILRNLLEEIAQKPEKQWYFQNLAQNLGWSYTHFYNRFRQIAGMGPQDYLAQQRVEAVKTMLRMTELRIGEIADRCGFCNQFALSRFFKHHVGMSPTQYRRKPIDDLREAKK
jgi:AraC-like DNA-binding protein